MMRTLTLTALILCSVAFVPVVHAQDVTIASLLAQVQQLQTILASLTGGGSSVSAPTLSRNLSAGSRGEDVSSLQRFLSGTGDYTYKEITGYYGPVTTVAVQSYQARNGIVTSGTSASTGYGVVGPRTRARMMVQTTLLSPPGLIKWWDDTDNDGGDDGEVGDDDDTIVPPVPKPSGDTVTIFDAVDELAPASNDKTVLFIQDINDSACTLTYDKSGVSSMQNVPNNSIRSSFSKTGTWIVAEWYKLNNFCELGETTLNKGQLSVYVEDDVNAPNKQKVITFAPSVVRLGMRSVDIYRSLFGGVYYSATHAAGYPEMPKWPHLLITRQLGFVELSDYTSLDLSLETTLRYSAIKTNPSPQPAPDGAQTTYDPKKHTTQFRLVLPLQWRDPSCGVRDLSDPVCKYHGTYAHIVFSLFDERDEFREEGPTFVDTGTNAWLYQVDLRDFLPNGHSLTKNPFKIAGNPVGFEKDILPFLKNLILSLEARAQNEGDPDKYFPPRLMTAKGSPETDEEYFAHFGIPSMNIGYEVPGLSHMVFDINHFTLEGTER